MTGFSLVLQQPSTADIANRALIADCNKYIFYCKLLFITKKEPIWKSILFVMSVPKNQSQFRIAHLLDVEIQI